MRYTTVIDISEFRNIYRNHAIRLVYLHLCLKAGYHDNDRDVCNLSIRSLAADAGLTVSAVRNALHVLTTHGLISKSGPVIVVKKFVLEQTVTARPRSEREKRKQDARRDERQRAEERDAREAQERAQRSELERQGKTQFMVWYEERMKAAESGDIDAIETVRKYKSTYDAHAAQFNQKSNNADP